MKSIAVSVKPISNPFTFILSKLNMPYLGKLALGGFKTDKVTSSSLKYLPYAKMPLCEEIFGAIFLQGGRRRDEGHLEKKNTKTLRLHIQAYPSYSSLQCFSAIRFVKRGDLHSDSVAIYQSSDSPRHGKWPKPTKLAGMKNSWTVQSFSVECVFRHFK